MDSRHKKDNTSPIFAVLNFPQVPPIETQQLSGSAGSINHALSQFFRILAWLLSTSVDFLFLKLF
jgi:hypothetical protein